MSPVSVIFALGMTTAGTTDESKTQNELRQFLRYPELGSDEGNVHKTLSSVISELRRLEMHIPLFHRTQRPTKP
jgi:serine protease inhibitor